LTIECAAVVCGERHARNSASDAGILSGVEKPVNIGSDDAGLWIERV